MTFQIIYPEQLRTIMKGNGVVLVDIRRSRDYFKGHYPGAVNRNLESIDDYEKLFDKHHFYILYCDHGGSSMQYARELGQKGYKVGSVVGGWEAMRGRE